jgi:hypothetical protein
MIGRKRREEMGKTEGDESEVEGITKVKSGEGKRRKGAGFKAGEEVQRWR